MYQFYFDHKIRTGVISHHKHFTLISLISTSTITSSAAGVVAVDILTPESELVTLK